MAQYVRGTHFLLDEDMKLTLVKAESRGHANLGWLNSHHSFSFGSYYDPSRTQFGTLLVLNDDTVVAGRGFGLHPHDNMEIISIPLDGALEHEDSMGHTQQLRVGDVQVMSAGTGLQHKEHNASSENPVSFLQIWITPRQRNTEPRYDQKNFEASLRADRVQLLVSPEGEEESLSIGQDAWISRVDLSSGSSVDYSVRRPENGLYIFCLEGGFEIADAVVGQRDALAVNDATQLALSSAAGAEVLILDVPMTG